MTFNFLRYSFLFVFLFCQSVYALKISGTAKDFEGKYVRLYAIDDFISYKEVKMDVTKIGPEGKFELNAYLIKSALIKIKIEDKTLDLIVFPDFHLKLNLTYDEEENQNRLYDKNLDVEILEESDRGINNLIFAYQKEQAIFLEEHHAELVTKKMVPLVQEFSKEMTLKYIDSPDSFKLYLEYDLASLEDAVLGSEKKLFSSHILDRPVLYGNLAYMKFFTQFYQERFIQISQGKKGFEMLSAVNGSQSYDKMMSLVKEHEFAGNDTTAQLFAILGLKEVYGDETFKKDKVMSMLRTTESRSLNPENARICKNIISELKFLKKGQDAPDFSLKNSEGEVVHLSASKNKVVLLFFWSANSNTCLRDFEFVKEYNEKYSDRLEVIAINMDEKKVKALKFIAENELKMTQLFKDDQYDLIDKYRLYSTPTYALLGKDQKIVRYPAPRPEENLEGEIYRLISKD